MDQALQPVSQDFQQTKVPFPDLTQQAGALKPGQAFSKDFVQLARAFGIRGESVGSATELLPALRRALESDGPALVAVPIDPRENAKLADML